MGPTWAPTSRGWSKDYTRYSLEDVWNSPGQIGCVWINTTYFYCHSHCPSMWVLLATPLVTVFWARAHPRQWGPLLALRWAGTQRAATAWESCVLQGLGGALGIPRQPSPVARPLEGEFSSPRVGQGLASRGMRDVCGLCCAS